MEATYAIFKSDVRKDGRLDLHSFTSCMRRAAGVLPSLPTFSISVPCNSVPVATSRDHIFQCWLQTAAEASVPVAIGRDRHPNRTKKLIVIIVVVIISIMVISSSIMHTGSSGAYCVYG